MEHRKQDWPLTNMSRKDIAVVIDDSIRLSVYHLSQVVLPVEAFQIRNYSRLVQENNENSRISQDSGVDERHQSRCDSLRHLLSSVMSFRFFLVPPPMQYTSPLLLLAA